MLVSLFGCSKSKVAEYDGIVFKVELDDSIEINKEIKEIISNIKIEFLTNVGIDDKNSVDCFIVNNSNYDLPNIEFTTVYLDKDGNEIEVLINPIQAGFTLFDFNSKEKIKHTVFFSDNKNEIQTVILKIVSFQYAKP